MTNRDDILVRRLGLSEDIFHWAEAAEESLKTLAVGVFVGLAYQRRESAKRM